MIRSRAASALALLPLLVASVVLAGCGTPVANVSTAITIDPDIGEVLAPPPANASPALTPAQALAASTHRKSAEIPPGVKVSLGALTLPIGPTGPNGTETYTAKNELVYGYSWHSCPVSRNPAVKRLPRNPCVEWNFLDANTGHQIDETWQMSG
jgi:hypothetical protein